jgi:UDP-N-acetylmuramoyl-L-alanyl-D-glutamate--2,6-diaminopimelate ligase
VVIGVTGTKGKTTTVEALNAIFEAAGYKTAIVSTLRLKTGDQSKPNLFKMTTPGRFFLQRSLSQARRAGCSHAILEMSSEGAKQYRHKGIFLDALVVTNIYPEHIESHGSYEKYVDAKLSLARELAQHGKGKKLLVINEHMAEAEKFLAIPGVEKITYSLRDTYPFGKEEDGTTSFSFLGERLHTKLLGEFNIENLLAAGTLAHALGVPLSLIREGVLHLEGVRGRMEKVSISPKQPFEVYVDYAHTADSLEKSYKALAGKKLICVLGATGGGRDHWKRPEMGKIAGSYCHKVILTNDDPYDEDPLTIINAVAEGVRQEKKEPEVIVDRKEAIRRGVSLAKPGEAVVISGKGTDPFLMGPHGSKIPWDDATIARECLTEVLHYQKEQQGT